MSFYTKIIYLMEFDQNLSEQCEVYVRYSDDILVLGTQKTNPEQIYQKLKLQLGTLGLNLNEKKTGIYTAQEGVVFLGYHLSSAGKTIPAKVEENLEQRLEGAWLEMRGTIQEKIESLSGYLHISGSRMEKT